MSQLEMAGICRGSYRDAVAELSVIVDKYYAKASKDLCSAILADVELAIECCDWYTPPTSCLFLPLLPASFCLSYASP